MKIGIKDGKIYDICSELINKRDSSIPDKNYIDKPYDGEFVGDNWDFEKNISLKDSPQRSRIPDKTFDQIKIEQLEARILALEAK